MTTPRNPGENLGLFPHIPNFPHGKNRKQIKRGGGFQFLILQLIPMQWIEGRRPRGRPLEIFFREKVDGHIEEVTDE